MTWYQLAGGLASFAALLALVLNVRNRLRDERQREIDALALATTEAAIAFDGLTMRGAVAAHLHAKIAETNPEEAARIEAMGDVMEAIRSAK